MVLDTSAVIAILREEPGYEELLLALADDPERRMSAGTYLETGIVADRNRDPLVSRRLDDFLRTAGVTIESVTEEQARIARQAYQDYGKGSEHPAQLNYGDCFAYALARERDEPLLYVGADFVYTDVKRATPRL